MENTGREVVSLGRGLGGVSVRCPCDASVAAPRTCRSAAPRRRGPWHGTHAEAQRGRWSPWEQAGQCQGESGTGREGAPGRAQRHVGDEERKRPPEGAAGVGRRSGARGGVFRELEISRPRCPGGQPRPGLKRLGFGDTRPFMTWTKAVIFCW